MRRILLLACALVVSSTAHSEYVSKVFKCSEKKPECVVRHNIGGEIADFLEAAIEIKKRDMRLKIDGDCESSCSMVADIVRSNTCVTPRAAFFFHQATIQERVIEGGVAYFKPTDEHFILPGTRAIREWNEKKGGVPIEGYNVMTYPETLEYWRLCPSVSLPPLKMLSVVPLPLERPALSLPGINVHGLY